MNAKQMSFNKLQIRFNWKVAAVLVVSLVILIKLGFWQLDRAGQKRQLQKAIDERQLAGPSSIESLTLESIEALKYRKVSLTGHYVNSKLIYVGNKIYQGRPGYEVIVPFKLKFSDQIVFVSRGWVPIGYTRNQLPGVSPVIGEQRVIGSIYVPPGKSFFLPEQVQGRSWPLRLHHFRIDEIAELFQTPLFPFVVRLDVGNQGVLERFWPILRLKPEASTAYAFQWFAMALVLLVVTVVSSTNIVRLLKS